MRAVVWLCLLACAPFAVAVEINRATQAELEALSGIGPDMALRLMEARQRAPFKDWNDLRARVKGIGPFNARRWSQQGLTIDGRGYEGVPSVEATASGNARP